MFNEELKYDLGREDKRNIVVVILLMNSSDVIVFQIWSN